MSYKEQSLRKITVRAKRRSLSQRCRNPPPRLELPLAGSAQHEREALVPADPTGSISSGTPGPNGNPLGPFLFLLKPKRLFCLTEKRVRAKLGILDFSLLLYFKLNQFLLARLPACPVGRRERMSDLPAMLRIAKRAGGQVRELGKNCFTLTLNPSPASQERWIRKSCFKF